MKYLIILIIISSLCISSLCIHIHEPTRQSTTDKVKDKFSTSKRDKRNFLRTKAVSKGTKKGLVGGSDFPISNIVTPVVPDPLAFLAHDVPGYIVDLSCSGGGTRAMIHCITVHRALVKDDNAILEEVRGLSGGAWGSYIASTVENPVSQLIKASEVEKVGALPKDVNTWKLGVTNHATTALTNWGKYVKEDILMHASLSEDAVSTLWFENYKNIIENYKKRSNHKNEYAVTIILGFQHLYKFRTPKKGFCTVNNHFTCFTTAKRTLNLKPSKELEMKTGITWGYKPRKFTTLEVLSLSSAAYNYGAEKVSKRIGRWIAKTEDDNKHEVAFTDEGIQCNYPLDPKMKDQSRITFLVDANDGNHKEEMKKCMKRWKSMGFEVKELRLDKEYNYTDIHIITKRKLMRFYYNYETKKCEEQTLTYDVKYYKFGKTIILKVPFQFSVIDKETNKMYISTSKDSLAGYGTMKDWAPNPYSTKMIIDLRDDLGTTVHNLISMIKYGNIGDKKCPAVIMGPSIRHNKHIENLFKHAWDLLKAKEEEEKRTEHLSD